MYCSNCGSIHRADANFCVSCGITLKTNTALVAPNAARRDTGERYATPAGALWNPRAAAGWALLFSPTLGAYLNMKNWQSLGEPAKAAEAENWLHTSILLWIAYPFLAWYFAPQLRENPSALNGIWLLFTLAWYFSNCVEQIKYVKLKQRLGNQYARRPWSKVLAVATLAVVGYWLIAVLILWFLGSYWPRDGAVALADAQGRGSPEPELVRPAAPDVAPTPIQPVPSSEPQLLRPAHTAAADASAALPLVSPEVPEPEVAVRALAARYRQLQQALDDSPIAYVTRGGAGGEVFYKDGSMSPLLQGQAVPNDVVQFIAVQRQMGQLMDGTLDLDTLPPVAPVTSAAPVTPAAAPGYPQTW